MYKLYHYPLCPFSRKVRFLISHFNIPCMLNDERFWERRESFLKMSPIGTVPLLVKKGSLFFPHSDLIVNHIIKNYDTDFSLIPEKEEDEVRVKSISTWFDEKFFHEVSKIFLYEKVIHTMKQDESPDVNSLNIARYNVHIHFEFLEFLLSQNAFLAGEKFTLADITAGAHISVLDYLSEIKWSNVSVLIKDWYSIVKSKIPFKDILLDRVPNIKPSITYEILDF
jgi:glutathione S-transferase